MLFRIHLGRLRLFYRSEPDYEAVIAITADLGCPSDDTRYVHRRNLDRQKEKGRQLEPGPTVAGMFVPLLGNRTRSCREHVVGVSADQPDGTHHKHENYRQHYRVFGDILALLLNPELAK